VDTGLCGFAVCLLRSDVADSGVDPPPIVVAFDVREQITPRGLAIWVVALMDEFGFQGAEEAFHRRVVPAICLAAHRLDDRVGLQDVAVVAGGVLGGFKRSSQRGLCLQIEGTGQAPLRVFSSQASFGVWH